MLYDEVVNLNKRLRLMHYKSLFKKIKEKDGSLSATEAFAVDAIYLLGEPTIKAFCDYLGISQPNATYKINNLIAKGYVEKVVSSEDKREYKLHLRKKFFDYYDKKANFIAEAVDILEEDFSSEELDAFKKMLKSLTSAMKSTVENKT